MNTMYNIFLPYQDTPQVRATLDNLKKIGGLDIYLLTPEEVENVPEGCTCVKMEGAINSEKVVAQMCQISLDYEYTFIYDSLDTLQPATHGLQRMIDVAECTFASMVYSDYAVETEGKRSARPLADYQEGSLRDDFAFGPLIMVNSGFLYDVAPELTEHQWKFAGRYAMRLALSRVTEIVHINEPLYTVVTAPVEDSKKIESHFDYVNPRFREVQIEMEEAVTEHLKEVGAYIEPGSQLPVDLDDGDFEYEASVIIPVRNRVRTIKDAVESALSQKAPFKFNVIVVDNHSDDGTTEVLESFKDDPRVVHIIPETKDLGIGGCWNRAVDDSRCGRFAIQLDSDDVYSSEDTIVKIVDKFRETQAGMVIGSYQLTNFKGEKLDGGVIDHREWTDENGTNNALRINGLGAPRAFFTPLLREIHLPNVSYGEDYAVGLEITRNYRLGRIWDVLYNCRRWEGNSDAGAANDYEKLNRFNTYKDRVRTWELTARQNQNTIAAEFESGDFEEDEL